MNAEKHLSDACYLMNQIAKPSSLNLETDFATTISYLSDDSLNLPKREIDISESSDIIQAKQLQHLENLSEETIIIKEQTILIQQHADKIKEQSILIEQNTCKINDLNQEITILRQQLKEESENSKLTLKKERLISIFWSITCALISGAAGVIISKFI